MSVLLRKGFYVIDVLICSIWLLLMYHTFSYQFIPWLLLFVYPMLMRLNISIMLYRHERKVLWGIVAFMALFILTMTFYVGSYSWDKTVTLIGCVYNEVSGGKLFVHSTDTDQIEAILLLALLWILSVPICIYAICRIRKKLVDGEARWFSFTGEYLFRSDLGRKFLTFAAIFFLAYLLGVSMVYQLSLYGGVLIPIGAYYLVNRYCGRRVQWWEYALLAMALLAFIESQHYISTVRIAMLTSSAIVVFAVCAWMNMKTQRILTSLFTFLIVGFMLPLMILGYNIYNGIDCKRCFPYQDRYIRTGVLVVKGEKGYGLRDRYRVIIAPKYKDIGVNNWDDHEARVSTDYSDDSFNIKDGVGSY